MEGEHSEPIVHKELAPIKNSDITMVFGQGPVQEYSEGQNEKGRTGLNFFSRLNGLAAAEMLIQGKTETVILSDGATGAKGKATEADLLSDIIKKRINSTLSDKSETFNESQRSRLQNILQHGIKIENTSNDTLENFVNILNEYIDADQSADQKSMTLLGIGFHAQDTHSGAEVGRLEKLAEIFDVKGQVVSAENVLESLSKKNRQGNSFVVKELGRLTEMAANHEVAQGKSSQEKVLVDLLDRGDWIMKVAGISNPDRLRAMLTNSPFAMELLGKKTKNSPDAIRQSIKNAELSELQQMVTDISPLVKEDPTWIELQEKYASTKGEVLTDFETLRDTRISRMLRDSPDFSNELSSILGIQSLDTLSPQQILDQARSKYADLKPQMQLLNTQINDSSYPDEQSKLILERTSLLSQMKPLEEIIKEDKYNDKKSYMMQYGKGEDPRK